MEGGQAYLQLRRDSIAEFDGILTVCRKLAAEARKYPAELALDFIEEVPEIPGLIVIKVAQFEEDVAKSRSSKKMLRQQQSAESRSFCQALMAESWSF